MDDGMVAVQGKDAADAASRRVRNDLSKAGLVENTEKSNWVPAQCMACLGFIIDLEKGKMEVTVEKLKALLLQVRQAFLSRVLPARSIASITGKIISMSIVLGPVTRLMTRSLYALISTRYVWCHMLEISAEARSELQFWVDQLEEFNGQDIWHSPLLLDLYTQMLAILAMVDIQLNTVATLPKDNGFHRKPVRVQPGEN